VATFAVAPSGAASWAPLPWEVADGALDPGPLGELSDEERAAVGLLDGPGSLGERVAPLRWDADEEGRASGRLDAGALHSNRAGAVQGGVLAGLAAAAARRAAGHDAARVASFHLAYLRPAPPGELVATGEVLHSGRRATLVRADVAAGAGVVTTATVALAAE
jgi:acyl-coenzyme A thioesterase PaaI-like protein